MNSLAIKKKIFVVLDLDFTILSKNSDYVFLDLLKPSCFDYIEEKRKKSTNWANHMQEVYINLKQCEVPLNEIKERVENIPFNAGFTEFFQFLKEKKENFDTLIISGANTLFLKWILEKNNLVDLFPNFYSNVAFPDESKLINIKPAHVHDCNNCDLSQCKRILFSGHLKDNNLDMKSYSNIIYAGDGENDYCLSTKLRKEDILFPRNGFPLYHKLFTKGEAQKLDCKICVWDDGFKILEEVQKLI
jgi:pyridoxal phosphate phosphatase PHOSPHO2